MNINFKKNFIMFQITILFFFILYLVYSISGRNGFENVNYLDGVDAIYWINLDRSVERRTHMENVLSDPTFNNIPNHRISATDGKIPDSVPKKLGAYKKQHEMSDYEYACLISHLDAIREFSNSNYKVGLIFEDDVTLEFKKYWKKSVREILDGAPAGWDVITLYYSIQDKKLVEEEYYKHEYRMTYALAYLINNKAAKKFISAHYKNNKYDLSDSHRHTSDWYIYGTLNTYVYKYPMFVYKTENDSTIHEDHLSEHVSKKNDFINAYKELYPDIE
uniref:Glycosyl transferase family 25 domain-containing protein n=1 Tax=viral metagenome TaxID=1070528 RepID=A0A6C0B3X8_9ZZZZ